MLQSAFLKSFLEGTPPKEIRMAAAGGFAPLPPEETLQLLVHLIADPDEAVSSRSRETLRSWLDEDVVAQVQRRECSLEVLEYLASASSSETVLEGIILNPATPGWIVAAVVLRGSSHLLETALYNRARLQDCPEILRNMRLNPSATSQLISLAEQIESELLKLQNQPAFRFFKALETVTKSSAFIDLINPPEALLILVDAGLCSAHVITPFSMGRPFRLL